MGYWQHTAYVRAATDAVASALTRLVEAEGRALVPRPPRRARAPYDGMQYGGAADNDLWGVAVFPGSAGWTVLKTAPLDLLLEPQDHGQSLLVGLCEAIGVAGFQLDVLDGSAAVLVEADGAGQEAISGFDPHRDDPLVFHGRGIDEADIQVRFQLAGLVDLRAAIRASAFSFAGRDLVDHPRLAAELAARLGGANAEHCDNLTSVITLVEHHPLAIPGGRDLYFRRPPSEA